MILTVLSKRFDKKGATDFAAFFEHDGYSLRLDWELVDGVLSPDMEHHVRWLMEAQIANDLSDPLIREEAFVTPARPGWLDEKITEYVADGWTYRKDLSDRL